MKKKRFDGVEMKRKGAMAVRRRLQGMSRKQVLEYWEKRHQELLKKQAQRREKSARTT